VTAEAAPWGLCIEVLVGDDALEEEPGVEVALEVGHAAGGVNRGDSGGGNAESGGTGGRCAVQPGPTP